MYQQSPADMDVWGPRQLNWIRLSADRKSLVVWRVHFKISKNRFLQKKKIIIILFLPKKICICVTFVQKKKAQECV